MPPMEEEEEEQQQASPTPQPKKRGRPRKDKTKEEREREEATPAERMREKKQAHHASTVDEKYVQWKSLVPVLYDWLANHNLVWPSLSCRWGPQLEQGKFKNRQRLYLSEQLTSIVDPQSLPNFNLLGLDGPNNGTPKIPNHSSCSFAGNSTDGSVPNTLVIAICDVVKSRVAAAEHVAEFNEEARSPFVKKSKTIIHPGEVNRIRELPQNNNIVATHTDSPEVLIWDVEDQSNRHAVLGAAESRPDLVLTGHQENAEFALAMCHTEPLVLSGGKDKSVVLWSIQDHVLPTRPAGSTKSIIKTADSIGPRGIFQGHEDTVEDVQFCPSSAQEFCSVGDDSCLILWDARVGLSPIVKVEKAHNADLHCVDWNPHDPNLILTGSADQSVRLFDRRNLISNGVGSPIHKFEGHKAAVLCVQWSPDRSSVFGSSAEDSLLNVWDYEKVGEARESAGRAPQPPPGLFFQHAGHRDKVVDFHWNAADPWTIVSVSDDCDTSGGGGTLQIWRMSDLIYRPEEEVVTELEKFKSHVIECTSKS